MTDSNRENQQQALRTSNPKALDRLLFEGVEYIPWSKAVDNTMNLNREIQRLMGALRGIATNRLTGSTNQTPAYSAGVRAGLAMAADMATRALEYHSLRGSPDETKPPRCPHYWHEHGNRCVLEEGHRSEHYFTAPASAIDPDKEFRWPPLKAGEKS